MRRRHENNGLLKFIALILFTALVLTVGIAASYPNKYVIVKVTKNGVAQADKTVITSFYDDLNQKTVSGRSTTKSDGRTFQIPIPKRITTVYFQVDGVNYVAEIVSEKTTTVYIYQ